MTQLETMERLRTGKAVAWRWTKDGMVPLATGEWTQATPAALAAPEAFEALRAVVIALDRPTGWKRDDPLGITHAMTLVRNVLARAESRADA